MAQELTDNSLANQCGLIRKSDGHTSRCATMLITFSHVEPFQLENKSIYACIYALYPDWCV